MVRAGVSTMKFKEANHDEPPQCSPLIGTGMSHAFRPSKKNEKYKNYERKSRVNRKNREKMLLLNQLVKTICRHDDVRM